MQTEIRDKQARSRGVQGVCNAPPNLPKGPLLAKKSGVCKRVEGILPDVE